MSESIEEETTRELLACGRCGHVYVSPNQLKIHLETDCGKIKKFECHCGNRYLTEAGLNQHKIVHEGQKKFLCDFCGKSFLSKGQLKIHERSHTNDKPFGCGVCNKRFAYRESLITHSTLHTGVKPYECQCCKKTFSCIGNLLKHRRTRPDTCGSMEYSEVKKIAPRPMTKNLAIPTIIEKTEKYKESSKITRNKRGPYRKKDESLQEMKEESPEPDTITLMSTTLVSYVDTTEDDNKLEEEEQITLIVTDANHQYEEGIIIIKDEDLQITEMAESVTSDTDNKELNSYFNMEDNSLICRSCPKMYKNMKFLLSHLRKEHQIELKIDDEELKQVQNSIKSCMPPFKIKEEPNSHICLKCGRTFSSKTVLSDHERSNCGKKPVYVCDICNKGYHSAGSLKTHKTVHTGQLNFVCSYCGQKFRTAGQVKIHSRKHNGEKPYKCKKCDKSFGYRESLINHESVHTGIKRFMCKCGQRFSCISNLKAHHRSHKDTCGKFPLVTKPVGSEKTKNSNK